MKNRVQKTVFLAGFALAMGLLGPAGLAFAIENEQIDCPLNDDRTVDRPLVQPSVVPTVSVGASGSGAKAAEKAY